ncbi:unnamed protein product, partial [marine sediment metagenome]
MEIVEITSRRGLVDATIRVAEVDTSRRKAWRIVVTPKWKPDKPKRSVPTSDKLVLRTNHPERSHIIVPVTIDSLKHLVVRPRSVFLGFILLRQQSDRLIRISSRDLASFGVKSAVAEDDQIVVGALQKMDGGWFLPVT